MIGLRLVSVSRYFFCPGVQGLDDPVCSFAFCVVGTIGVYPYLLSYPIVVQLLGLWEAFWDYGISRLGLWDFPPKSQLLVLWQPIPLSQGWNYCRAFL